MIQANKFTSAETRELSEIRNNLDNCVFLPCSDDNIVYPNGDLNKPIRRWTVISKTLLALSTNLSSANSSGDLMTKAVQQYAPKQARNKKSLLDSYLDAQQNVPNGKQKTVSTLKHLINCALKLPELVGPGIPLLRDGNPSMIALTRVQIHSLLANAFCSTFPQRGPSQFYKNYPTINFASLLNSEKRNALKLEKLKCVMNYFQAMRVLMEDYRANKEFLETKVKFERKIADKMTLKDWEGLEFPISNLVIYKGKIEDCTEDLQVDFANKTIGGGVLGSGAVMEEIYFCIFPELLVARLFIEELGDLDTILVQGAYKFNHCKGYADTLQYIQKPLSPFTKQSVQCIAMDAMQFQPLSIETVAYQYKEDLIARELNKASSGFQPTKFNKEGILELRTIASGKWGCGVFGGDPHLKCLIQLIAASRFKKTLKMCVNDDDEFVQGLQDLKRILDGGNISVKQLLNWISVYPIAGLPDRLFPFVFQQFKAMSKM